MLLIMLFYLNSAFGKDANSENELIFLKGASKYTKNEDLRPLKEFKVGKKYCLWGTKNWDDTCQDAAMKYAFGPEWREFKRVALEFVELVQKNDLVKFAELFDYDLGVTVLYSNIITIHAADASFIHTPEDLISHEMRNNLWKNSIDGTTYEQFLIIANYAVGTSYHLSLSRHLIITFKAEFIEDTLHYFPKIDTVITHE